MSTTPARFTRTVQRIVRHILIVGAVVGAFLVVGQLQRSAAAAPADPATTQPAAAISPPLFSEDFESGTLDKNRWTIQITGHNTIDVQKDKAAHGTYALCVRCPEPSNKTWAFISTAHLPDALKQHHFGRAYMFIAQPPPARHTIFIMSGLSGFPNIRYEEVATANGKWQLTYVDLTPAADGEDFHAGGAPPINRWFCLEWEFNDHPNHAAIWVDGQPVYASDFRSRNTGITTDLVGGFTDYSFGFRLWGDALTPFDLYFDDIAIDTKRIGPIAETGKP
jgi:hypothetical protein